MQRKTIHRSHWNQQLVEVVDEGDSRFLYFGGTVLQSSMFIAAPHKLALSYTRYMMASLLLDDQPQSILIVGVGAGSLVRFLHHHLPTSRIDAIDCSSTVLDLAGRYFHLPAHPLVTIHCRDGHAFLSARTDPHNYDLILIDAFDTAGMAKQIYNSDFFQCCRDHLSIGGIVSINLWSGDTARMEQVASDIAATFESLLELPVPKRGNVICLAGRGDMTAAVTGAERDQLHRLQERFEINFREIVRVCRKYNLSLTQRFAALFN